MKYEIEGEEPKPMRFLTDDEFRFCYSRVPCLCLDIVIVNEDGGVLFARREIEPFKGLFTLPGGILRYGEPLENAFTRLIKKELGVTAPVNKKQVGAIQHLVDGPFRSSVSLAYLVDYQGEVQGNAEGRDFRYITDFTSEEVQPYQAAFFLDTLEWQQGF